MKKIIVVIVTLILTLTFINPSFARRSRESIQLKKDYYICLRNLITKYLPWDKTTNFMRGFYINQQVGDQYSPQLQEVCQKIRKAIFKLEEHQVKVPDLIYFMDTFLPFFQTELYNFKDSDVYDEVLNVVVSGFIESKNRIELSSETILLEALSKNSSTSSEAGRFCAHLFYQLRSEPINFETEFQKLEGIIRDEDRSYSTHLKHRILSNAKVSIESSPEDIYMRMPEIELLITGTQQDDLFLKVYSTTALSLLCHLEGISSEVREYIFQCALDGVKRIPWDVYFDREGGIPEEVNYLVVCINYLIDAEEISRVEFGLNVDLGYDSEFVTIYRLLLMRGFNLEQRERFLSIN